ncbi:MAG: Fn3-like domain-containing protein [Evtepia sp.]
MNIAAATSTKAYLTAVGGGRPKVELGDDAQKTGKYEVKFEVHNLTNEELTYTVGGYIQTDAQEVTKQIKGQDVHQVTELPYKLSTQIAAQKITVPASGTVTVTVPVSLNQPDRDYMDSFANGTYIEGFVTLTPESRHPAHPVHPLHGLLRRLDQGPHHRRHRLRRYAQWRGRVVPGLCQHRRFQLPGRHRQHLPGRQPLSRRTALFLGA